jgi:hypothetical protein
VHGEVEYDQHNGEGTATTVMLAPFIWGFSCLRPFIFSSVNPHRQIWLITKGPENRAMSVSTKGTAGTSTREIPTQPYTPATTGTNNMHQLQTRPHHIFTSVCEWRSWRAVACGPSSPTDPSRYLCSESSRHAPRVRTASVANRMGTAKTSEMGNG